MMITKEDLTQAILDMGNRLEKSNNKLNISHNKLAESQAKTDEQMKKTDEQMKKTDARLDRVAKLVGNISNNQGDIAEEFFWNTISSSPILNGIKYDSSHKNAHKRIGDIEDEYDILMVNGKDIAIIEVKYKAHTKDIKRLINEKYTNFKKLYLEYKNYHHHLALASFNINDDVKKMAKENNVLLLQRKGDLIETI